MQCLFVCLLFFCYFFFFFFFFFFFWLFFFFFFFMFCPVRCIIVLFWKPLVGFFCDCGFSWTTSMLLVQSTLVISNSKGLSEALRDIRTSKYQSCRSEAKKITPTTTFNKWIFNLTPEVRDILKILWKRGEIAPRRNCYLGAISTLFHNILLPVLRFPW